jgi:4-hydroxy-2-oxoheptanedioate aldolase
MYSSSTQGNPPDPPVKNGHQTFSEAIRLSKTPLLGTVLALASVPVAQLAAGVFDWVMIDMEHSPLSAETATHIVHAVAAVSNGGCLPLIRVPAHGVEWIKWALDSGAAGIVIPMVNNAAEMEAIIDKAIFPPRGRRSFGPFNAAFGAGFAATDFGGYYKRAQRRDIAILPMIESAEGLANAEAIMSVDGVSGVFIGPYDLRLALGLPGGIDGTEKIFEEALEKICGLGRQLDKPIGCMGVGEHVAGRRAANGMKFLLTTVDNSAMLEGFNVAKARALSGITNQGQTPTSSL